jgi:hypothetical protein
VTRPIGIAVPAGRSQRDPLTLLAGHTCFDRNPAFVLTEKSVTARLLDVPL